MRGEGIPASLGGQVPEVLRRRLLTQQHPEGHSKIHGAARSPKTQSHKVGGTQGGQQHRAHPRVLGLVPGARARAALLPLPPSDFGEVAWMPSRASVSPRETWPRGNQQQLARGRDAHTSPREAPAHSSSLQNTARRVGRKKTPKARKKKNTNKTSKHGSPSPEHVGQSSAPCRKAQRNLKFQESSDLATCTPRGPRHEPGRGLLPTLLLLPRAAGFCCWGRARSVVTSLWVQGPLSITGNELVRRGRRERETQKERKRLESSHFHFLLRDGPRPRATGLGGGEQSWLSTALSGLGSAASFSQRAHRSSPSL